MTVSAALRPAFSLPNSEPAGTAPKKSDKDSLGDEHDFEKLVEHAERLAASGSPPPQRGQSVFGIDLLRENSRASQPMFVVDSDPRAGHKHFSAEVLIGDNAVAFSSRPLVAPAAVQNRPQTEHFLPAGDQPTVVPREIANALNELVLPELKHEPAHVSSVTISVKTSPGELVAPGQHAPDSVGPKPSNMTPGLMLPAAIASLADRASQQVVSHVPGTAQRAKSTPIQPMHHLQTSPSLFAQLIPGSSEYRILVRGQRLGDLDRDHLIQRMNLTITQLGLAVQPIHITLPEASA